MSVDQTEETQWCNADNADIYHNMPIRYLKSLAKKIGLDDHCDLKQIAPYIERSRRVLEIGCGYGRVIEGLQKINPALDITVVEREPKFVEHVQTEYPNVHCIAEDILTAELKGSYDLVLMMWSTLGEFSRSERYSLISKISSTLDFGGKIAIEYACVNETHPYLSLDDCTVKVVSKSSIAHIKLLNYPGLVEFMSQFQVAFLEEIRYLTDENFKRTIFMFSSL